MIIKLISLAAISVAMSTFAQAPASIGVFIDGNPVVFQDQRPIERRGHIYVPIKGVFQKMGAKIWFDEAAKMVRITYGEKEIEVPIGADFSTQDGAITVNGGRAIIVNGRAMAPLRFLSEQLDAKVMWDGATRSVRITTQKVMDPPSSTGGSTGGG